MDNDLFQNTSNIIFLLIALVFIWLIYIYIPARMARKRNRSVFLCILLTILIDPIIAYIIIALIGNKKD